jgi:hypothetical protein
MPDHFAAFFETSRQSEGNPERQVLTEYYEGQTARNDCAQRGLNDSGGSEAYWFQWP